MEERIGVVLIGHGAPATDCPPQMVGELMSLEWRGEQVLRRAGHPEPGSKDDRLAQDERIRQLDAKIRDWPRHLGNDPYKAGLERLASELKPLLSADLFAVGYNEFCRPSISEAVEEVIGKGAARVLVIPSMLTPGGLHSEVDIPRALESVRAKHPEVAIEYLWPFDLKEVARLLASQIEAGSKSQWTRK